MLSALSLRARLLLGVIALAAGALAVANLATYASLRSFLFERTDSALKEEQRGIAYELRRGCPHDDRRRLRGGEPGDFVQIRVDGDVVCEYQLPTFGDEPPPEPDVPGDLSGSREGTFLTLGAVEGRDRYRGRVLSNAAGDTFLVATPLTDVDATLRRLLLIELLVTALALLGLGLLAWWVVRIGLRPLDAIGATATAIAGGDLTRRVERAEPNTEVGRLGIALNTMLGRIESSFNAQAASERKLRRFVADASHELRTPLAAVRAYAELFERGADRRPEDLARAMDGIVRESERMSVLVDDLLLLARLDEGRPLEREPVALDEVVGEAVETARAVEPGRPIAYESDRAVVVGDRERLRQIVDNLLANVRAHTPPDAPVEVRVATRNGSALVEVEDSGRGIPEQDRERVFQRFYRTDESRSRASGGVGLGLSIVAAVAEAHGGSVAAEAVDGAGTTVRITLPLAPA